MKWHWQSRQPLDLDAHLPVRSFRDCSLFAAIPADEKQLASFRASFPSLYKQSPDPRLYRLSQIFNTPLLSMSGALASKHKFAYWGMVKPENWSRTGWSYFWYFNDLRDDDLIVLNYTFDEQLIIYSSNKPPKRLFDYYREVSEKIY